MQNPAGNRLFTRRRLVAGGALLSLALATSIILLRPQSVHCDLKLEFVGFDTSADGSWDYALLRVHNESSRSWVLLGAKQWSGLKNADELSSIYPALGRFTNGPSTGESGRASRSYIGGGVVRVVHTNTVEQVAVELPQTGAKGWVELFCWTRPKVWRGPLKLVQDLWWQVRAPMAFWVWVRCDVPIECGRDLSDGTSTRPRVLSQK